MTDICMVVHNRPRITKSSILEIHRRTTTPHRLVVYDNGSDDETLEILHGLQIMGAIDLLVKSEDNNGIHWGHNSLLELVRTPVYVSADNDLVPESPTDGVDWLTKLIGLMENNLDYAAIACLPHAMIGDNPVRWEHLAGIAERRWVGAHLRVMRTDLVQEVGGWKKEKRPSRNNEERWICSRLTELGHKVGYAMDIRCIHLFGEDDEDPWGYSGDMAPEDHGHREVWPPPNNYGWHRQGVDWETCRKS